MDSLGQTARGLLASCFVLSVLVAVTLGVLRRWPLESPSSRTELPAAPTRQESANESIRVDRIRVALTRRPAGDIDLAIDSPYQFISTAEVVESFETPLPPTRVAVQNGRFTIGDRSFDGDTVTIRVDQSPGIWINGRQYRGEVRLHALPEGRIWPINVVPLEEYLAAVVDSEMPASFPAAAREAQAIVARTYAISCCRNPPHRWFDLFATPVSQNYLGVVYRDRNNRLLAGETPAGRDAAEATRGIVCTCDGHLFRTYYSACCGGRTLSGAAVFNDATSALAVVECEGCRDAPLYRWQRAFESDDLLRLARSRSSSIGTLKTVATSSRPGRLPQIRITGDRRSIDVTATEAKSILQLPSLMFELTGDADAIVARGRGHGHGVGLCQWGAKGMAEAGATAEQILQHYYPGSTQTRLP